MLNELIFRRRTSRNKAECNDIISRGLEEPSFVVPSSIQYEEESSTACGAH